MRVEMKHKAGFYALILIGITVSIFALFTSSRWFAAASLAVFLFIGIIAWLSTRSSRSSNSHDNKGQQEQFRTFIQESQVVADRLAAAVEEVNRSIGHLLQIADASIQGEEDLKIRSNQARWTAARSIRCDSAGSSCSRPNSRFILTYASRE
ncbi:hypothetical protein [Paenibacillus sp. V4I5]|uniref:hypothetical protein n=1 Tax=Paenibacillus sp. V4I5 TaxID=3042306 RepID=UPI00278D193E|nr:hypothetical protein [Paenibacillus sp. V4I5]MDQ0917182.1 hypothetical protein [Paenibacillus sp. V4I5]